MKRFAKGNINLVVLLIITGYLSAQVSPPQARPYTLTSTYEKHIKKYPFISLPSIESVSGVKKLENIAYQSSAQDSKTLDLFLPQSEKPSALVIMVHGGGWISGVRENLNDLAVALSNKGFAVANLSYTLSAEAPYPKSVLDIKEALVFLKNNSQKWDYNPNKIALLGCSAGAQLAALVALTPNHPKFPVQHVVSENVQAIVNVDGIVSFIHKEASSEGLYAAYWLGGHKETHFEQWKEASPLEYLNAQSPPILFLNSAFPRFHAGRDDMIAQLNQWGIASEVQTFDDAPHSFWLLEPWFSPTTDYIANFLNKIFE